jgi:hypothetical protein
MPLDIRIPAIVLSLVALASSLPAQRFDELAGLGLPRTSRDVRAMTFVDVDADGDRDLVVGIDTFFPGAPLELWENVGYGRFERTAVSRMPIRYAVASEIVAGDVDQDGDEDLFVAARDGGQDLLYLNDGTGTFTDGTAALPQRATDSRAAALADLDGDNDLDLVVAVASADDAVLYNDGSGNFSPGAVLAQHPLDLPIAVIVTDLDAVGNPEIVVFEGLTAPRLWFEDLASGGYTERGSTWLPASVGGGTAAAAGDLDGDGDTDFVLGQSGSPDLLLTNDAGLRLLGSPLPSTGDTSDALVLDVDGDSDLDLLLADRIGEDRLLLNDGSGAFAPASAGQLPIGPAPTRLIAAADVDGDGDLDVAQAESVGISQPGRNELLINDGGGGFLSETETAWRAPFGDTAAVVAVDLDQDGQLDLVAAPSTGQTRLWFGARARGWDGATVTLGDPRDAVRAIASGDIDGDGDMDLLLGISGSSRLIRNDGARVFTDVTSTALPPQAADTTDCVLVDVDGDGDLDAYLTHAGISVAFPQSDALWLNDGTGNFQDVSAAQLPTAVSRLGSSVAAGDVDGDGDVDLLIGNETVLPGVFPAQSDVLLLNDGSGNFVEASGTQFPADSSATVGALLVDVDGDGDLDAVAAADGEPLRLALNDGTGTFTPAAANSLPAGSYLAIAIESVDLDDDGDRDLVVATDTFDDLLLENDGAGNFALLPFVAIRDAGGTTSAYFAVDVDGDGDEDLVQGAGGGQRDRLLFNLTRHIDLPYRPRPGQTLRIDSYAPDLVGVGQSLLLVGLQLSPAPIPLLQLGYLELEPSQLFPGGVYPIGTGGVVSLTLPLASTPTSIGQVFHVQALNFPTANPSAGRFTQVRSAEIRP